MKKLSALFVLLCLPTFAFADACLLSFRGGSQTAKRVVTAWWYDDGKGFFVDARGGVVPVNGGFGYDYKDVSLDKLKSVNGKDISVPNFLPGVGRVYFNCNKWQNGEYFAYYCGVDFLGGNKVGVVDEIFDVYDECIKSVNEEAESTTASGDDNFADGCSLSFRGGYQTAKRVVTAWWDDDGADFFVDASGDIVPVNGGFKYDYKDVSLDKLKSVNGKDISVPTFLPGVRRVYFNCNKWQNGKYFAYYCGVDFKGVNKVGVYNGFDIYNECIKSVNEEAESTTESGDDNEEIKKSDDVFAKMDNAIAKNFAGSDVWKDENGEFNTSRLVSDSIAGVVLGTAGGIITSKIVGKNQIDNGMQDLKCTINGQNIASFGDDFVVEFNN